MNVRAANYVAIGKLWHRSRVNVRRIETATARLIETNAGESPSGLASCAELPGGTP